MDHMGGDVGVPLAAQHRHAGEMRLRALAFQRDLQFHARQLAAEAGEMAAIASRRARCGQQLLPPAQRRRGFRRDADMLQLRARAQHDLEADIAEIRQAGTPSTKVSDAPSSSTISAADMARAGEIQLQRRRQSPCLCGTRKATPPADSASEAAPITLPARPAEMRLHPVRRVGQRQDRTFRRPPAGRRTSHSRHHRADAGFAQRRFEIGIFPLLDPAVRHAMAHAHTRGGLGLAASSGRVASAVMPPAPRYAHSPWLPAPAPVPCRLRRRCGRRASTWMRSGTM